MASQCNRFIDRRSLSSLKSAIRSNFRTAPPSLDRSTTTSSPVRRFSLSRSPSELGCVQSLLPLHSAVATARMMSSLTSSSRSCRALSKGSLHCSGSVMFSRHFHYEDVLRQDLLLKLNYANIMEVPRLRKITIVPKAAPSSLMIKNGKLAMEILGGQKLISTQRALTGRSSQSKRFLGSHKGQKGQESDLAQQSTLRGPEMSNFLIRICTIMSLLDTPVKIQENAVRFSMEMEFCQFSPELEDHFEVFEHIRGVNVTIVTSAKTQHETSLLWSGFLQKDEGGNL